MASRKSLNSKGPIWEWLYEQILAKMLGGSTLNYILLRGIDIAISYFYVYLEWRLIFKFYLIHAH